MIIDWPAKRDSFDKRMVPALIRDLWQGDPATLRFISQDYNIVYRFEAAGQGRYLRICHPVLHPLPEARQVMHFLRFLAINDVSVAAPLPSVSGNFVELLDDGYFASAQAEAPGHEMSLHMTDLSVYQAWGRSLGKLHAASRRYHPDPDIDYAFPSVQRFWKNIEPAVRTATSELKRIYAELTDFMQGLPRHDYGLIHGDYRPGNVIWDGKIARTIDFDEPNYHWYIADVSRALLELSHLPTQQRRRFREEFMRGYLSEHEIDDAWVTLLPQFAQHRGMLMHIWDVQEGGSGAGTLDWAVKRYEW